MPPKAKFTKDEIIDAGIEILREKGIESVTAREIGNYLNSSARPIFTVFNSMNEVLQKIENKAKDIYAQYVKSGLERDIAFKGVGQAYIKFAKNEPKLFQLLFMKELPKHTSLENILPAIDDNYDIILKTVKDNYGLSDEDSLKLYHHIWIYTHGIATLFATGMCSFSDEEISNMLTEVFTSILIKIKTGVNNDKN
ncbi:MAG: TetR/AcrR family transcriptional regulator [Ruminococcus sp.]|nr:TetR/AcrR family transcriptional regulator [Ruminococcus sp.]